MGKAEQEPRRNSHSRRAALIGQGFAYLAQAFRALDANAPTGIAGHSGGITNSDEPRQAWPMRVIEQI